LGAMYALGSVEWESGHVEAARRRLEAGLQEIPSARLSGHYLVMLGNVLRLQGELDAAQARIEEALAIFRTKAGGHLTSEVARALDWLAVVTYEQGDYATARGHWREALSIRQQ